MDFFSPQGLNAAGTGLDVFRRVFGGLAGLQHGRDTRAAAEYQAAQLRQNAGQAEAAAQRDAITADEQAKRIASRALAVAAASGGGASDPTVVNIIAGIASEGAYRQALALYQGQERGRTMRAQADAASYEGQLAERNAFQGAVGAGIGAGTAALQGIARGKSLYEKYGMGGPGTAGWGKDLGTD